MQRKSELPVACHPTLIWPRPEMRENYAVRKGDFFKAWLPVTVWGILMFAGSTEVFSGYQTSRFITPFLLWLDPHMSYRTIEMLHILIRKLGHVFEYAVLAILLWRAFRRGTRWQA